MRRLVGLLLVLPLYLPAPVEAEPPPHLDFIRGLRNDGLGDLAMEYIEKLRANPPAEIVDILPLEHARTLMELSSVELDESKRSAMLAQARVEFETYLKKNANHAEANVEMARLQSYLARMQLNKAFRADDEGGGRAAEAAKARPLFKGASERFQKSAKLLDDEIKKLKAAGSVNQSQLKSLQDSQARARLEEMVNLFYISETYFSKEQVDLAGKADALKRCRIGFGSIYESSETVDRYGWIAAAWYAHASALMDLPLEAGKRFKEIEDKKNETVVADGFRMARFFRIKHIQQGKEDGSKNPTTDVLSAIAHLASGWLKDYPNYRNSSEGLFLRYIYGLCEQKIPDLPASRMIVRDEKTRKVISMTSVGANYLQEAARYFKELTEFDNEYYDKASRRRQEILIDLADSEEKAGPVLPASVLTFDRAVLQAQIQEARLSTFLRNNQDPSEDDKPKVKAEEKSRISKAIAFLERALQVTTPKDQPRDIFDAKYFLARCYLYGGQPMTAAIYGESLARNNSRQPKAAAACALAVQGYNRMAGEAMSIGDEGKVLADADIDRLKKLTGYMEKTWPSDAATEEARQICAIYLMREKNYPEAIALFSRIHPGYSGYNQAKLQQGGALQYLIRGEGEDYRKPDFIANRIKKYGKLWNETMVSLRGLPEPSAASSFYESQNYVSSKLQLCQLLLLEGKQYKEIETISRAAEATLTSDTSASSGKDREKNELLFALKSMRLSGLQGQAAKLMRDGEFPKVLALIKEAVAAIKADIDEVNDPKNAEKAAIWKLAPTYDRYGRSQREILVIALRASIQDGQLDEATNLLNTLDKLGGSLESRLSDLRSLVGTVRTQFDLLHKAGKVEEEKKLVDGFGKFLDQIAAQPKLPLSMQLFLAQGYGAIDQNAKSVDLLEKLLKSLPEPKGTDNSDAATKTYRQVQFNLARSYRAAKMFDKAKEFLDKQLIGGPQAGAAGAAAAPKAPKGPFYSSVEARRERAHLYEDMGDFRAAVAYWTSLAKMFGEPLPPPNPENQAQAQKRALYFDLFFESQRCSVKAYTSLDKAKYAKQIDDGFTKVAQRLFDMDTKNPDLSVELKDKVRELIEEQKALRDKYKALGGKLLDTN